MFDEKYLGSTIVNTKNRDVQWLGVRCCKDDFYQTLKDE